MFREILKIIVLLLILISSCKEDKKRVEDNTIPLTYPIVEGRDTITNGDYFEAKVFLSNKSIYTIAKANQISDYLKISYEEEVDPNLISQASKKAEVKNDTGYIKFRIYLENIGKNELKEVYWLSQFDINFLNNNNGTDTTFLNMEKIYVKGKN
jgi:hypothetical protein